MWLVLTEIDMQVTVVDMKSAGIITIISKYINGFWLFVTADVQVTVMDMKWAGIITIISNSIYGFWLFVTAEVQVTVMDMKWAGIITIISKYINCVWLFVTADVQVTVTDVKWAGIVSWGYQDGILRVQNQINQPPVNFLREPSWDKVYLCVFSCLTAHVT